ERHPAHVVLEGLGESLAALEHHALVRIVERYDEARQDLGADKSVTEVDAARILVFEVWEDRHHAVERERPDLEASYAADMSSHLAGHPAAEGGPDGALGRHEPARALVEPQRVRRTQIHGEVGGDRRPRVDLHSRVDERLPLS